MNAYDVMLSVDGTIHLHEEADSADEAKEIAYEDAESTELGELEGAEFEVEWTDHNENNTTNYEVTMSVSGNISRTVYGEDEFEAEEKAVEEAKEAWFGELENITVNAASIDCAGMDE